MKNILILSFLIVSLNSYSQLDNLTLIEKIKLAYRDDGTNWEYGSDLLDSLHIAIIRKAELDFLEDTTIYMGIMKELGTDSLSFDDLKVEKFDIYFTRGGSFEELVSNKEKSKRYKEMFYNLMEIHDSISYNHSFPFSLIEKAYVSLIMPGKYGTLEAKYNFECKSFKEIVISKRIINFEKGNF